MKACVLGLWHLGTVTSACLASGGHDVTGLDFDADVVVSLAAGKPPLFEPGLKDLVNAGLASGHPSSATPRIERAFPLIFDPTQALRVADRKVAPGRI